jgi:hypothetical protein
LLQIKDNNLIKQIIFFYLTTIGKITNRITMIPVNRISIQEVSFFSIFSWFFKI